LNGGIDYGRFLTTNPALALLKKDHDTVKDLFDKFEKTDGRPAKKNIVKQALTELRVHAAIEEALLSRCRKARWERHNE
jgi:hypothetical protein